MPATKYRLALAVTLQDMPELCRALEDQFPNLVAGINAQWLEMLNSGVNIFGDFEQQPGEPDVGLSRSEITFMTGIAD